MKNFHIVDTRCIGVARKASGKVSDRHDRQRSPMNDSGERREPFTPATQQGSDEL